MGHILIGIEMVRVAGEAVKNNKWGGAIPPISNEVNQAVLILSHCIASHHGSLEFGSPLFPQIPEAIAFHWLDQLDARMNICWSALKKKGQGDFTERQYFLG